MTTPQPPAGWYDDPEDATKRRWWDGAQWSDQRVPARGHGFWSRRGVRIGVLVVAGVLLVLIFRPGGFVTLIGFVGIVIGIVAIAKSGLRRLRIRSRAVGIAVAAASFALIVLGGGITAATTPNQLAQSTVHGALDREEEPSPSPDVKKDKIEVRTVEVTEVIPFEQVNQDDPAMDVGATAIAVAGINGVLTRTYTVTFVNGIETERELAGEVVTIAPVAEVTSIGSRKPPPAAAAPAPGASCHASYTPCVGIGPDADCAGGGGNGPIYVTGPVQVIGPDSYKLDRDGDGIACDA